jgi:site-specific DNA recombinase
VRTVIYTRQSLDNEKQKNSTDMQKNECMRFAKKNGYLVHEHFNEGEKSARITNIDGRPELSRLLHAAEAGSISNLIVYKRDRLARNVEQYLKILKKLQKSGVNIHFVAGNEPPVLKGPIGEFLEMILAGLAQQEGENIHRRQMESRIYNARNGFRSGGPPPFGYKIEMRKLVPNEHEEVVLAVYELFNKCWDPHKSLLEIVKDMRKKCNPLHRGYLDTDLIKKVIPRSLHRGEIVQHINGIPYPFTDDDARIVDDTLWTECNEKLRVTSPETFEEKEKNDPYYALLVGRVVCGNCDASKDMVSPILFIKKKRYYVCPDCKNRLPIKEFDSFVLEKMLTHLKDMASEKRDMLQDLLKDKFLKPQMENKSKIEKKLLQLESKIKKKMDDITSGILPHSEIYTFVKDYKHESRRLASVGEQIHLMEGAIQTFDPNCVLRELKPEKLSQSEKAKLLATLKNVIHGDSEFIFNYKVNEGTR